MEMEMLADQLQYFENPVSPQMVLLIGFSHSGSQRLNPIVTKCECDHMWKQETRRAALLFWALFFFYYYLMKICEFFLAELNTILVEMRIFMVYYIIHKPGWKTTCH